MASIASAEAGPGMDCRMVSGVPVKRRSARSYAEPDRALRSALIESSSRNRRMLMSKPNIVVLGSGMAGYGATYRLHAEGIAPVMYDKNSYYGGPNRPVSLRARF